MGLDPQDQKEFYRVMLWLSMIVAMVIAITLCALMGVGGFR